MKYIKTFENLTDEPQIGDYVVCEDSVFNKNDGSRDEKIIDFITNNVGQYIQDNDGKFGSGFYKYVIKYENVPSDVSGFEFIVNGDGELDKIRIMTRKEILFYSKNKKDCEEFIVAKKYNV